MTRAAAMLANSPADLGGIDRQKLSTCIEACYECAQTCTACADACLGEQNVAELTRCIRTNLDCADICGLTGRILSRQTDRAADLVRGALQLCVVACRACGDECLHHGEVGMQHCRECAESCRRCEQACRELLATL
jgi:hypothetical protein